MIRKKLTLILLALVAIVSCSNEMEFPPQPSITLPDGAESEFLVEEAATTLSFAFASDQVWSASVEDEAGKAWCSVTPSSGASGSTTVSISVAANPTPFRRTTQVILRTGERAVSRRIVISQFGMKEEGSIRILAIGNSFSVDAMEYLWHILSEAGYSSVKLGNLYIGGCSLETHAQHIVENNAAYEYRVNTDGTWVTTPSYSSVDALKSENWDYITLQQVSGFSGIPDSYEPALGTLLQHVRAIRPNARLLWHMTWAYQQSSTHADFSRYGKDQTTMYEAILSTVQDKVQSRNEFTAIIPSGTAIQNLRTSLLGDNLTRDGYHLDEQFGRYAAALMWARQIGGCDVDAIEWTPDAFTYSPKQIQAIKEAVNNAFTTPFAVTESTIKEDVNPLSDLQLLLQAAGYNPADYAQLSFDLIHPGYYNSSSDIPMTVQTNMKNFATTRIFAKSEFPAGTLIVQKSGYQYRPEGWTAENAKNSSRPGNVATQVVEVNDAWWGDYNFRAFNIQKSGVGDLTDILDEVKESFGIFVPLSNPELEKLISDAGYDPAGYRMLAFDLIHPGYYNSASDIPMTVQTNMKNFATTRVFAKSEFPAGTLIVQKSGYQYRPEGWTAENTRNSSRPDNVSTTVVKVDDAWWGSYNFRAFNIQKTGVGDLSAILNEVKAAFGIYVPRD